MSTSHYGPTGQRTRRQEEGHEAKYTEKEGQSEKLSDTSLEKQKEKGERERERGKKTLGNSAKRLEKGMEREKK